VTGADDRFTFNVVWCGTTFEWLGHFVASQIANSGARFRFVANGCPPEEIARMERFAEGNDRVIEVVAATTTMEAHGVALDAMFATRDDGDHFCFVDPDILARGPYLDEFAAALDGGCAGVTSGRGVWRDDDLVPPGHPGVSGEYFYSQEGYLFGSPHFAMYRRSAVEATLERWGVGYKSAGPDLSDAAKDRLAEAGHRYWLYDTGKIVNILLQEDGNRLCHFEHPNLMHIGGLTHYLAPPGMVTGDDGEEEPDWSRWRNMTERFEVARFTATVLKRLCAGEPAPAIPAALEGPMRDRLERVRAALVELLAVQGGSASATGARPA
jgi:hypothetical protein